MAEEQGGAVQAPASGNGSQQDAMDVGTLPDGHGGVITRTAPSTTGDSFAGWAR